MATLPAITCTALDSFLTRSTARATSILWPWAVSDHDHVDLGIDQCFGAGKAAVADSSPPPRPATWPVPSFGRVRGNSTRLSMSFDRNQADAVISIVDHQQLFDPARMKQTARLFLPCPIGTVARFSVVISSRTGCSGFFGKAHIAVGEDADQPAARIHHPESR